MLDPHAADLVDAVARLCVLRTEDYTLLLTAHRRTVQQQQQELQHVAGHAQASPLESKNADAVGVRGAPGETGESAPQLRDNKAYIRYLTEEVQAREQLRRATEKTWLAAVRRWAECFVAGQAAAPPDDADAHDAALPHPGEPSTSAGDTEASPPWSRAPAIWGFWAVRQEAAFQQMYAAVLRQSYELHHHDLTNTPFARMRGCQQLFDARAVPPAAVSPPTASPSDSSPAPHRFSEAQVECVHRLFFPPTSASPTAATALSPSRLLAATHPIRAGDGAATFTDASRTRLQASHHVWLVLFFLWCHVVGAGCETASRTRAEDDVVAWQAAALLDPAESFLSSQARQLRTLLETAHAATEVGQAAP